MEITVFCKIDDKVKCPFCGKVSRVSELTTKNGHKLSEPGSVPVITGYRHCCDETYACVFIRGDLLELVNGTGIVKE